MQKTGRSLAVVAVLVALLGACNRRATQPALAEVTSTRGRTTPLNPAPLGTVVFLGDSLTAGLGLAQEQAFPALIQARLEAQGRPWKVVNAGISGDTTAGGVARLDWIYKQKVDVMFICLGANDGLRGIPVAETERNLRVILDRAQKEGTHVLIAGIQLPENYGATYRTAFAQVFPRLAKDYQIPLLPFLLQGVAMDSKLNQADGIHPNAAGAQRVADTVWNALQPVLQATAH